MQKYKEKIPNFLTFTRIALIPILIISFYFENRFIDFEFQIATMSIFVVAAITDYFDGYLSRKWQVQSKIGTLMDPIADKLIVTSALALIIDANNTHIIPAIGILCREIFISGLREFLAETKVKMPVTHLAKWKTAIQMTAISILLLTSKVSGGTLSILGTILLWLAFILTIYTGWLYFNSARKQNLI
jgi:CDP-diacylglycerol--glycerol-3-phosphate 3-phosphatidyltransferase